MSRSDKLFLIAMVRPDKMAETWELFREFLVPAFVAAKNTNPYTQRALCMTGHAQLWAVVQADEEALTPVGIFFTGIVDDGERRIVDAHTMSGKYLPEWAYLAQNVVERFALENNCTAVRFMGRRALSRIYHGYRIVGDARPGEKMFERILA